MPTQIFERPVDIRFSHCDPAGIVFHPQYYYILNALMEDFYREVLGTGFIETLKTYGVGFPIAGVRTDFAAPSRPGEHCTGRLWIERLGESSVRFAMTITCGDEMRLQCVETAVCVKSSATAKGGIEKAAVPEVIREKFAPYVRGEDLPVLELRA